MSQEFLCDITVEEARHIESVLQDMASHVSCNYATHQAIAEAQMWAYEEVDNTFDYEEEMDEAIHLTLFNELSRMGFVRLREEDIKRGAEAVAFANRNNPSGLSPFTLFVRAVTQTKKETE